LAGWTLPTWWEAQMCSRKQLRYVPLLLSLVAEVKLRTNVWQ